MLYENFAFDKLMHNYAIHWSSTAAIHEYIYISTYQYHSKTNFQ